MDRITYLLGLSLIWLWLFFSPTVALAHCPLCVAASGVLVILARVLGVSTTIVGVFIGAAAVAMGLWLSRIVPKRYLPYQSALITLAVFISVVLPLLPLASDYRSLPIFIFGSYGSWFYRTYIINKLLLGSILGGLAMIFSEPLNRWLIRLNNKKKMPFQHLLVAIGLLIVLSAFIEITGFLS